MVHRKKVTFIGGGSYQWVPVLFRNIAVNPQLQEVRSVLHDIERQRNLEMAEICRIIGRKTSASIEIEAESSLDTAIDGASAVILCISLASRWAQSDETLAPVEALC